jgi:hypothetical protein
MSADPLSYAWSAAPLDMTSVIDGRTHSVAPDSFDAGIRAGRGRYRAVCGTVVVAAALTGAPGPSCPACRARRQRRPETGRDRIARLLATSTSLPFCLLSGVGWNRRARP